MKISYGKCKGVTLVTYQPCTQSFLPIKDQASGMSGTNPIKTNQVQKIDRKKFFYNDCYSCKNVVEERENLCLLLFYNYY